MIERIRDYEMSLWTLQDSFITVLKSINLYDKDQIQNGRITLQDDGENRISFDIPMYYHNGNEMIENPLWYNKLNGNLIANLRKIKVIFNKQEPEEEIFEFLITKVTESHEGFEKTCSVEGEGLAFNELGHQGYKISLSADDLYVEAKNAAKHNKSIIFNNINYWCKKVFKNTNWSYSIQMDWTSYDGVIDDLSPYTQYEQLPASKKKELNNSREALGLRRRDKVYEDPYVIWGTETKNKKTSLTINSTVPTQEKFRIVEGSESNRYNLIQTIAETFGVFTKFKYIYDDNYHIIGRQVIFYNNFLQEAKGVIDLTYGYDTQNLRREMDAENLVTKMYVKSLDDAAAPGGQASIMDTEANKSGEDYLLNFDYLYGIGAITKEQYKEIEPLEKKLGILNREIIKRQKENIKLQNQIPSIQAKIKVAQEEIAEAQKIIDDAVKNQENIADTSGVITIENDPEVMILTLASGNYSGKFQYSGVLEDSIKIYPAVLNQNTNKGEPNENEITYTLIKNEKTNAITGITIKESTLTGITDYCFAIYSYNPQTDYINIKTIYENVQGKASAIIEKNQEDLDDLNNKLEENNTIINEKLEEKEKLNSEFEIMMGPALREGNWQPEDSYAAYGTEYKKTFSFPVKSNGKTGNDKKYLAFSSETQTIDENVDLEWTKATEDEDDIKYYYGVGKSVKYYPFIYLDNLNIFKNHDLDNIYFYYDNNATPNTNEPTQEQKKKLGSVCKLVFIHNKEKKYVKPALVIMTIDSASDLNSKCHKEIQFIKINNSGDNYSKETLMPSGDPLKEISVKGSLSSNYEVVYPRLHFKNRYLNYTEDSFTLQLNGTLLNEFDDYYETTNTSGLSLITIKPEVFLREGLDDNNKMKCTINYFISSTGLKIYLDAREVMKENAYPKVSYKIEVFSIDKTFIKNTYARLGQLAHINDTELKFENVMGYISGVELDLDHPWQDVVTIKNYKTKFEDLFSTIVAQTEVMKSNSAAILTASEAFNSNGELIADLSDKSKYSIDVDKFLENTPNLKHLSSSILESKINLVNSTTFKVMNGEIGLAFQGGAIDKAVLNQKEGLYIEGTFGEEENKQKGYFKATNSAMGFFKKGNPNIPNDPDIPLLYFTGGDLAISGTIYANTGWIGGEDGWIIAGKNNDHGGRIISANGQIILDAGYINEDTNERVSPSIYFLDNTVSNNDEDKVVLKFVNDTLTVKKGTIGGWTITDKVIKTQNDNPNYDDQRPLSSTNPDKVGAALRAPTNLVATQDSPTTNPYAIAIGTYQSSSNVYNEGEFKVKYSGEVTATNIKFGNSNDVFRGQFNANSFQLCKTNSENNFSSFSINNGSLSTSNALDGIGRTADTFDVRGFNFYYEKIGNYYSNYLSLTHEKTVIELERNHITETQGNETIIKQQGAKTGLFITHTDLFGIALYSGELTNNNYNGEELVIKKDSDNNITYQIEYLTNHSSLILNKNGVYLQHTNSYNYSSVLRFYTDSEMISVLKSSNYLKIPNGLITSEIQIANGNIEANEFGLTIASGGINISGASSFNSSITMFGILKLEDEVYSDLYQYNGNFGIEKRFFTTSAGDIYYFGQTYPSQVSTDLRGATNKSLIYLITNGYSARNNSKINNRRLIWIRPTTNSTKTVDGVTYNVGEVLWYQVDGTPST